MSARRLPAAWHCVHTQTRGSQVYDGACRPDIFVILVRFCPVVDDLTRTEQTAVVIPLADYLLHVCRATLRHRRGIEEFKI